MKLISLNIWEGVLYQPLVDFIEKYWPETDIFCFQEVFRNDKNIRNMSHEKIISFHNLKEVLKDFDGYFEDYIAPGEYNKQGLATFLRKSTEVEDKGEIFLYNPPTLDISNDNPKTLWRNLQYIKCKSDGNEFLIANMHGLFDRATKTHKDDIPERIEQSKRTKELLDKFYCPKVLCGDFNLWPNTESMRIIEQDMRNLVKEFDVYSTRSGFFNYENKFADYILVSYDVKVNDFRVIHETVSDHLPLYLDFE